MIIIISISLTFIITKLSVCNVESFQSSRPEEAVWLAVLCLNRLGTSLAFMMYAGVLGSVSSAWRMKPVEAGFIQTAFNVSYAASLVVSSLLTDRFGAKPILLWSSGITALAAAAFAAFAHSYATGLVLFGVLGLAQGGTYAPPLILVAQNIRPQWRGTAVGLLLAASSAGYLGSLALSGLIGARFGSRAAFSVCGAGPLLGLMAVVFGLRSCPTVEPRRGVSLFEGRKLYNRRALLVTIGYAAHCWELLGMWAWMPAFLGAALRSTGGAVQGQWTAIAVHGSGGIASLTMGRASDRVGRKAILITLGLAGALCSFAAGWLRYQPSLILILFAGIYSFAAMGDSAVLSTAMTEAVDGDSLGAALAGRSLLGFGAGGLAPVVFGAVLGPLGSLSTHSSWGQSFAVLGFGGVVATICALLLPGDLPARHKVQNGRSFDDSRVHVSAFYR